MRVFLTGVACVGKTTVGAILAGILEYPFFDLDEEVEKFFKMPIERLQEKYLTMYSYREEASKALIQLLGREDSKNSVIALPPSGLMHAYWRIVKKTDGITVVLRDDPKHILERITFYDKDSNLIQKNLNKKEKRLYLREIKKDITYFNRTYIRANITVDISGLNANQAAAKIKEMLDVYQY